jgi:hypothetical protein
MLIATGATMVLLAIIEAHATTFHLERIGSVVGSAKRPTMMSGRASARRRSATRLHASLSLRARFGNEAAGGP